MHVDSLLHARWIIPVIPEAQVLDHHAVAVTNGRIRAIVPQTEAREQIRAETVVELGEHALIPGLVNSHTHAAMSLLRGLADDLPLMTWLNEHIWPAESKWVDADFVAAGTRLSIAEMIRSGTTCFNDMYFFPDASAEVSALAGLRAVVGLILIDFPSAWAGNADGYLARALEVHDRYRGHALVRTAFAPHAPYSVSDAPLQRLRTLANELELPLHMHVHETAAEVDESVAQHGCRPLARLDRLGLLCPELIAVHMTQLEPAEIARVAEVGATVVHCPESNQKLASGFCPVERLLAAGVRVALGTDGAASNNDLDMLAEMRTAAQLGKCVAGDAGALPAERVLRMATLDGAHALGLDDEIGSLEVGKAADIVAIDLHRPETQPLYHPISQIVYAAGRDQVTDVWVAGEHLLDGRQLLTLDAAAVVADARRWGERIQAADEA